MKHTIITCLSVLLINFIATAQQKQSTDVLVVGGSASGTSAAIHSARSGAQTVLVEGTPWLGGMLTAAGVSATDGNHRLPSGLWAEFRQKLYDYYGGPQKVFTGWVSNTQFEPSVGNKIFQELAKKEAKLTTYFGYRINRLLMNGKRVEGAVFTNAEGQTLEVRAKVVVDATELGDLLPLAGVPYNIGMDAQADTGEPNIRPEANSIIQDFTYAVILKDYGANADMTLPRRADYDSTEFDCCCSDFCVAQNYNVNAKKMLDYGKLPNGKYMINWPKAGNDYYANVIEMTEEQRLEVYKKAKEHTLNFVYFIQKQLGFKNLGIADDEYPTADKMPFYPYHRESRRMRGEVRFTVNHILEPYRPNEALYRTGAAVGDYPIDHHHSPKKKTPSIGFPPVPSFTVPLAALLPKEIEGLLVAEKSLSVTNLVNGSTRLQPCVMLIGQAAGAWAAEAAKQMQTPRQIQVRQVQDNLLAAKCFLQPFLDVKPEDPFFGAVQRVGSTGILKGRGVPHGWANETWFYPDTTLTGNLLQDGLRELNPKFQASEIPLDSNLTYAGAYKMLKQLAQQSANEPALAKKWAKVRKMSVEKWLAKNHKSLQLQRPPKAQETVTKKVLAAMIDQLLDPFHAFQVDFKGQLSAK
jgi:hypothetical protein